MTKLPDSLTKLRETYPNEMGFQNGFDSGAEAMRIYMQTEINKLETSLDKNIESLKWLFARCRSYIWLKTDDAQEALDDIENKLSAYRTWKDEQE